MISVRAATPPIAIPAIAPACKSDDPALLTTCAVVVTYIVLYCGDAVLMVAGAKAESLTRLEKLDDDFVFRSEDVGMTVDRS